MKRIFRSKRFLFSVLVAACIGILAVCFVVNRDRDNNFQPEDVAAIPGTRRKYGNPHPYACAGYHKRAHGGIPQGGG